MSEYVRSGAMVPYGSYDGFGATPPAWETIVRSAGGGSVLDAAKKHAAKIPEKYRKVAFTFAYVKAREAYEKIRKDPTVQQVIKIGDAAAVVGQKTVDTVAAVRKMISGRGGFTHDASGMADASKMVHGVVSSIGNLVETIDPGSDAAKAFGWATTISACGVSIAAGSMAGPAGTIGGAVTCGVTVMMKFISGLSKDPRVPNTQPKAMFMPNEEQTPLISLDATRLASVLKYHYGVNSYREMYTKAGFEPGGAAIMNYRAGYLSSQLFPPRPAIVNGQFKSSSQAPPAHDMYTILGLMLGVQKLKDQLKEPESFETDLIAKLRSQSGQEPEGEELETRYANQHDVNVAAIETGAWVAKQLIERYGVTSSYDEGGQEFATAKEFGHGGWGYRLDQTLPWMMVDELLNFFTAVTVRELKDGAKPHIAYLATGLPVKLLVAHDTDRRGMSWTQGQFQSKHCWTNLYRAGIANCRDLIDKVPGMNFRVIKEFAAIRLMAAFSYMHMNYMWTAHTPTGQQTDLIASVPPVNPSDPVAHLQIPVSPLRRENTGSKRLKARRGTTGFDIDVVRTWRTGNTPQSAAAVEALIAHHESTYGPIIRDAQRAAQQDDQVAAFMETPQQTAIGPAATFQRTFLSQGKQLQIMIGGGEPAAQCKAADGTPQWVGDRLICIAPGETLQQAIARTGHLAPGTGAGGAGGAGGALMIAGAAALALMLLR